MPEIKYYPQDEPTEADSDANGFVWYWGGPSYWLSCSWDRIREPRTWVPGHQPKPTGEPPKRRRKQP